MVLLGILLLLVPMTSAQSQKSKDQPSVEARLQVLEDREEIRQLLIDYGRTLDQRDFAGFARLFAENAQYGAGTGDDIKGPAAIAKFLEETFKKNPTGVRSPNFHLFANPIIRVKGDEATAVSKGMFVVPNQANVPEIVMLAAYSDTLVRAGGQWKFKRRIVHGDIPAPGPKK